MDKVIENTNSIKQPEEWRPIPGYEGLYEVSNYGRVKSFKLDSNGRILVPGNSGNGYHIIALCKDGKRKMCKIHRLVATAFISNPSNLPEVNHKDENRRNNYLGNLEWCDHSYNNSYGTKNQRAAEKISIPVVQLDKAGNLVAEYKSILEASMVTSASPGSICSCCKHKYRYKSAGGFIWIYKSKYEQLISENKWEEFKKNYFKDRRTPVVALDKEGNLVAEYSSIKEASMVTGVAQSNICNCCQHKPGHYSPGGFIFRYKDEYTAQTQRDK